MLSRSGRQFLVDAVGGSDSAARGISNLIVVSFYLISLGFVALTMQTSSDHVSARQAIQLLATKLGAVLLVLGALYLLGILLDPANEKLPFPVIFTGPADAAEYFEQINDFIGAALGPTAQSRYRIIIGDPADFRTDLGPVINPTAAEGLAQHVAQMRKTARIVKACRDLPGYELFQYLDDAGERHTVSSTEVNAYLREITGEEITAKDFRTWAGTNLAALALREFEHVDSDAMRKRAVVRAVERVAKHLGNTPAVCRRCYIHPDVFEGFLDGTLLARLAAKTRNYLADEIEGMSAEEAAVVAFLRLRLGELAEQAARMWR